MEKSRSAPPWEEKLLALFQKHTQESLGVPELLHLLGSDAGKQGELEQALGRLERRGEIARIKQGNRFSLPQDADLIPGRIRINRQGAGFVQPDAPGVPVLRIPPDATQTAMHGDRVLARLDDSRPPREGVRELNGRVVRVLEKARTQLVGTLQRSNRFFYVVPDDPRIPQDIYVPPPKDVGRPARVGDKVVVELAEWTSRHTNPEGEILEILGPPDAEGVDMLSVLRQYNLELHFPKTVLQEARAIGTTIKPGDIAGREDCRAHQVITIDPDDAKDFDDAICVQAAGNGQWKVWVHIADVSHYVKAGTALDTEAYKRGNSTYLVDRVIPMLPEALSNELCSLKPDVDRLTKCAEFLLSPEGSVLQSRFYSAVIRSQRRFTYKEAFAAIERPAADPIDRMLHDAHRLAQMIRRARFKAGSLNLDFPETKIILDDHGRILRIDKVENDVSHQLIEEYMLLANEAVATRLLQLDRPALHRIHEPPDPDRLQEYREEVLGHQIPCGNLSNRHEVQKLLERLGRLPIGQALKIGFLRSLMRARYSTQALGHYGLAKAKYTHFTSPIRRYADLVVHRALFPVDGFRVAAVPLKEAADHVSETERISDDAERDSRDVKLFAFLIEQLKSQNPQQYPGMVTQVRNFGFFVEVPALGMSGLVPLSGMTDDFYQFDSIRSQLVGRRTRRLIKLGDPVTVQVAKVDTFKRQVDYKLAAKASPTESLWPRREQSRQQPRDQRRQQPREQSRQQPREQSRQQPRPERQKQFPKTNSRPLIPTGYRPTKKSGHDSRRRHRSR